MREARVEDNGNFEVEKSHVGVVGVKRASRLKINLTLSHLWGVFGHVRMTKPWLSR